MSSVSSVNSNSVTYTPPLASVASSTSASASASASSSGASAQLSGFGQLMSQLQSLEQSNPSQAQQVLSTIADKLNSEAQSAGGTQGQHLSALAQKFEQASQTGDLSGLKPPTAPTAAQSGVSGHHHGGHHHSSQSYSGQAQSSDGDSLLSMMESVMSSVTGASSSSATGS